MVALASSVTAKYNLGPVKAWVESAAYLVGEKFGVKTIYGWRKTDPFPDHPAGLALDYMITSKDQGQAIADYLVENSTALGVKYVIWNHQVWEASGKPVAGWHPYTSTSNPHTDHVHVTFNDQPGTGNVTQATNVVFMSEKDKAECAWALSFPVFGSTCLISKKQARSLIGATVMSVGVGITMVGIVLLVVYGLKQTGAAKLIPGARVVSKFL